MTMHLQKGKEMPGTKKAMKDNQEGVKSLDDYLDEALQETFPASDPVAISKPDKKEPLNRDRKKETKRQG